MGLENEIAKGMSHLADSRIVHRDLAARNILLTDNFTPKIFNFAVSCDVYDPESYNKLAPETILTRWLAIESLTDGLHTTKSNVWSFAVLMWEIETGGEIPYKEHKPADLVRKIDEGYRLPVPEGTPNEMYRLMLQCWDPDPDHRPTFHEIVEIFKMYIGKEEARSYKLVLRRVKSAFNAMECGKTIRSIRIFMTAQLYLHAWYNIWDQRYQCPECSQKQTKT